MRQKRVKSYRKVMQMYQSSFKEPYQLLVDAEFVKAIVAQKLDIQARLTNVLQGTLKRSQFICTLLYALIPPKLLSVLIPASLVLAMTPVITQCCMQALYDLGPSGQPAVDLAKEFERRKCNHLKARPGEECLTAMAGKDNPHRYVIATQSLELRKHLRTVPGLPIVYLNRSVVLLESPSDQTMKKKLAVGLGIPSLQFKTSLGGVLTCDSALQMENAKLHVPSVELATLAAQGSIPTASNSTSLIDSYNSSNLIGASTDASTSALPQDAENAQEPPQKKKKKGPKGPSGPNPLSMKKKKKAGGAPNAKPSDSSSANKKRPRSDDGPDSKEAEAQSGFDRKKRRAENEAVVVMSSSRRGAQRGVPLPPAKIEGGEGTGEGAKRKRKRNRGSGTGA